MCKIFEIYEIALIGQAIGISIHMFVCIKVYVCVKNGSVFTIINFILSI